MSNTYKCSVCKNEYEKGWDDIEAEKEMKDNFGQSVTTDDCEIVCDDCYKEIMVIN
jgi:DNA-directed RNA polymerase subunit RPC12/RpoP